MHLNVLYEAQKGDYPWERKKKYPWNLQVTPAGHRGKPIEHPEGFHDEDVFEEPYGPTTWEIKISNETDGRKLSGTFWYENGRKSMYVENNTLLPNDELAKLLAFNLTKTYGHSFSYHHLDDSDFHLVIGKEFAAHIQ
jgi:hypothetical protein